MAQVLMIYPDKCTGCRNCELACSFVKEGEFRPSKSRIHAYNWEREGFSVPMMCQQCADAACVAVCPTGAMRKSSKTPGLIEWDEKSCIKCKMCTMACPFGNAAFDSATGRILKCDNCGGDPECVSFCPNKALDYVNDTVAVRSRKKAFAAKFKEAFQEVR